MKTTPWLRGSFVLLALTGSTLPPDVALAASDSNSPAFNLFSVEQDIEIGAASAAEAEQKLSLLNDPSLDRYLNRIVQVLAVDTPGAKYPYHIKAVDDPAINAFSLPGGPMYANRGLVVAARSEAELTGVIAHEMAHIALRHGTHQASKEYLANAGLGILGGLLGKSGGDAAQMLGAVGGLGLNAAFLKFSRDDEYQADRLGAEIMASAGYDPTAMADFFTQLRAEGARNPGALEAFFSDHPPSADREARIREQAKHLARAPSRAIGGFEQVVAGLQHAPSASRPPAQLSPAQTPQVAAGPAVAVRVAAPSARFETFEHRAGYFAIEHPVNWKVYARKSAYATSIAPAGGVVQAADGQQALVYGVAINHYAPFDGETSRRGRGKNNDDLKRASDDLVQQVRRSSPYLSGPNAAAKRAKIDGASTRSVTLSGRSTVTGEDERVVVFTRRLPDGHVLFALLVAPARDYDAALPVFTRMMRTLAVHDAVKHG